MALPSLGRMSDGSLTSRSDSDSEEVGEVHFTVSHSIATTPEEKKIIVKAAKFELTDCGETSLRPMTFHRFIDVNI